MNAKKLLREMRRRIREPEKWTDSELRNVIDQMDREIIALGEDALAKRLNEEARGARERQKQEKP